MLTEASAKAEASKAAPILPPEVVFPKGSAKDEASKSAPMIPPENLFPKGSAKDEASKSAPMIPPENLFPKGSAKDEASKSAPMLPEDPPENVFPKGSAKDEASKSAPMLPDDPPENVFPKGSAKDEASKSAPMLSLPDLLAFLVNGPGQVHVGSTVEVNVTVLNEGGPVLAPFGVQVLLSTDLVVDPLDLVVGETVSPVIGTIPIDASIPADLTPGYYYWAMRVLPAMFEQNLDNNESLGLQVIVWKTKILVDESPIHAFARPTDPEPPYVEIGVANAGSEGSVLTFVAFTVPEVPWLTVSPHMGYAFAGKPPNMVELYFDHVGLPLGEYNTELRLQNFTAPWDIVAIPVTLTIGEAWFAPGSKIIGDIDTSKDFDTIEFDGIKKLRVFFRVRTNSGDLEPILTIIDPFGEVEEVLKYPHNSDGKFVSKSHKLKEAGLYTLVISGKGDTKGGYRIRTRRVIPFIGHSRTEVVRSPLKGDDGKVPVALLPGAVLAFHVDPNDKFSGVPTIGFEAPGHVPLTVSPKAGPDDELYCVVPLMETCGRHLIVIGGFGSDPKERVKLDIFIKQPKKGNAKIILP